MTCDEVREQIPAYVLGALTPRERARLETHIQSCPDCALEMRESLAATTHLAIMVPQVEPSSDVRVGLLRRVRQESQQRRGWPITRVAAGWQLGAAGALGAALAVLFGVILLTNRQIDDLETQTHQQLEEMAGEQEQVRTQRAQEARQQYILATLLAAPNTNVHWAQRNAAYPDVRGMILTSPDQRWGLLTCIGLEVPPPEERYQVWLQQDHQMVAVGSFTVDESSWCQLTLQPSQPLSDFQSVSVTMEPMTGSPAPTGSVVFRANLTPP